MDFEYYEDSLIAALTKTTYEKDKAYWLKVYNAAEVGGLLSNLNEIIAEFKYQLKNNVIDNPPAYLTSMIKKEIPMQETTVARFEGNLVESPFYRSGKRTSEPIKLSNTRTDPKTNDKINTLWTTSSSSLVPNDEDADVFKTLLQLYHEQGMPESGEVRFTFYELCKKLNKSTGGASYIQIKNALKYLYDTSITSKQAFLRYKSKVFLNTNTESEYIRLIDTYKIHSSDDGNAENDFKSRVVIGRYLVENLRLYYSVNIDFDFYINLKFSLAKRMYEYLQKKRGSDKKIMWKERLIPLAEKMAMSIKTPRNIKHNLKTALEELKEKRYLYNYEITKDGKVEYIKFFFIQTVTQIKLVMED